MGHVVQLAGHKILQYKTLAAAEAEAEHLAEVGRPKFDWEK